jgi:hypothetical protein
MISSIRSMTRVTGPIFYMCISLSAFMTSRQITIARSTMTYSCVPFYALSSNAFVAILYSILVRDAVLLAPNLVGMVLGIICVFTFHFYAVEPVNYRVQLLSFYVILAGLFFFCLSETKILGILMDITCVVMLSSPLANIYEVCRERNTDSISFLFSLTAFMNAISWTLYGAVRKFDPPKKVTFAESSDYYILVPNALALVTTTAQMLLFCFYGLGRRGLLIYESINESEVQRFNYESINESNIDEEAQRFNRSRLLVQSMQYAEKSSKSDTEESPSIVTLSFDECESKYSNVGVTI